MCSGGLGDDKICSVEVMVKEERVLEVRQMRDRVLLIILAFEEDVVE